MQSAKVRNFKVWFENSKEFHHLKREVFGGNGYWMDLPKKELMIFDVGAHIGLTTLYFKMVYPKSRVVAIEPHPETFKLLQKNVEENNLDGVELLQTAVGAIEGTRDFFSDSSGSKWFSSSSFWPKSWKGTQVNKLEKVKVVKLSSLITKPIDLLKLDIEGAEEEVLLELSSKLNIIRAVIFEFHPVEGKTPEKIIELLEKHDFQVDFFQKGGEVDWRRSKGLLIGEATRK